MRTSQWHRYTRTFLVCLFALGLGAAGVAQGAENLIMQIDGAKSGRFASEGSPRSPNFNGILLEGWSSGR